MSDPASRGISDMRLADRMSRIGTESAFEVLAKARALEAQGRSVIHLEIGQPDFPTPRHVLEAGKQALDDGWTGYGPTSGFPDVREAIAAYVSRTRNIRVGAERSSSFRAASRSCSSPCWRRSSRATK